MEYIFLIAFVALLIAFCFSMASGTVSSALSECQSSLVNQYNRINNQVEQASH